MAAHGRSTRIPSDRSHPARDALDAPVLADLIVAHRSIAPSILGSPKLYSHEWISEWWCEHWLPARCLRPAAALDHRAWARTEDSPWRCSRPPHRHRGERAQTRVSVVSDDRRVRPSLHTRHGRTPSVLHPPGTPARSCVGSQRRLQPLRASKTASARRWPRRRAWARPAHPRPRPRPRRP